MNKAVLATLCFAAGAGFGFVVGYYVNGKVSKEDKEFVEPIKVEKPTQNDIPNQENPQVSEFVSKPAKIAKPGQPGINYRKFVKDLKYKQESEHPEDDEPVDEEEDISEEVEEDEDEIDMSEYEETYEERIAREAQESAEEAEQYKKEHKGKIELMSQDDWDTDFRENDYDREDIYYFTVDDVITDEDGHPLNEEETIGKRVRQVGWMQSPEDVIYIRNHPKEKEYRLLKENMSIEDWFA